MGEGLVCFNEELDFEKPVDQESRAKDQTFGGVPDPKVPFALPCLHSEIVPVVTLIFDPKILNFLNALKTNILA